MKGDLGMITPDIIKNIAFGENCAQCSPCCHGAEITLTNNTIIQTGFDRLEIQCLIEALGKKAIFSDWQGEHFFQTSYWESQISDELNEKIVKKAKKILARVVLEEDETKEVEHCHLLPVLPEFRYREIKTQIESYLDRGLNPDQCHMIKQFLNEDEGVLGAEFDIAWERLESENKGL
jgi:hypothetical protein